MISTAACDEMTERMGPYLEKDLPASERKALESHVKSCDACRDKLRRFGAVRGLLQYTSRLETRNNHVVEPELAPEEPEPAGAGARFFESFAAAPWWAVSLAMHALLIALAGLVSMAIELPRNDDLVIMTTELQNRPTQIQEEQDRAKPAAETALLSKADTPPTDVTSHEVSDIVVPPDILAKAELGDHFETINPDRPDTQSAYGNEDAKMFHSVEGNADKPGGGGTGGLSMEDVIGIGGAASRGTGGGWGGGDGTGIGVQSGAGKGSFGNRNGGGRKLMVKRHGGSAATESAVEKALRWLAYHQEADGHWEVDKFLSNKEYRYGGSAGMSSKYVPGITGLATLAFLGAGHSTRIGQYKDNVKRAVAWMLSQQGPDGDFTAKFNPQHKGCQYYGHCICTLACGEALAMDGHIVKDVSPGDNAGKSPLQIATEKGVELILKWQAENSTGGWTYYAPNVTDPTVTGWAVMALKSAKVAGIHVPADAILKAKEAVKKISTVDKNKGDYGWTTTGYLAAGANDFASKGYACTAAGMVINLFLGVDVTDDYVAGAASYITQDDALPNYIFKPQDPSTDHQNLYYWYYGTLGSFQAGGDYWKKWNAKLKEALVPNQCKDGDNDGSWAPDDVWGAWGGRVYSTALACLSLEVYYRYEKLGNK
jgi:hypothetical protein